MDASGPDRRALSRGRDHTLARRVQDGSAWRPGAIWFSADCSIQFRVCGALDAHRAAPSFACPCACRRRWCIGNDPGCLSSPASSTPSLGAVPIDRKPAPLVGNDATYCRDWTRLLSDCATDLRRTKRQRVVGESPYATVRGALVWPPAHRRASRAILVPLCSFTLRCRLTSA